MGLCLSQCGQQAQHKAAVVAVSISQQSCASPTRPSRDDASLSLKRFLHLYSEEGSRKLQASSTRPSLEIPHSSELFSLPSGSECEGGRSRSPSPARGSVARSSTSSTRGRKSVAITRKSCSSLGQAEPHNLSLVDTISRLEKFCDVKLFPAEYRSASFRHENSILLHDSCRELAQKLLCFANEHAYHGNGEEIKSVAPECAPLEKSVASFLIEVENFVSQAAAPQQQVEDERDGGASSHFLDADDTVQFTDFEATFDSSCPKPAASLPSFDATQEARPSVHAECRAENSAPVVIRRPGHRHSRTTSDFGRLHHIDGASKVNKPNLNAMPRLALKEISSNVTPPHEQKNHPLKVRGVTRSLDLQDGSIPQMELGAFKREQWRSTQAAVLNGEESARLTPEKEGGSASPSADVVSQPTEGRVSVHVEEEPVCTNRETESADHTGLLNIDSERALAMAFDKLLRLLQSPTAELAHSTSELLEVLAAPTELSADGVEENAAPETLPVYETESWHDAPASLNTIDSSPTKLSED